MDHHKKKTLLPHGHKNGEEERDRLLTLFGKINYFTTILLKTSSKIALPA
jgi:hypothetical protein